MGKEEFEVKYAKYMEEFLDEFDTKERNDKFQKRLEKEVGESKDLGTAVSKLVAVAYGYGIEYSSFLVKLMLEKFLDVED
ncbi:hypothetical protein PT285_03010 [Lactobacillus sp. ESL0791]|uniref:hypothetical protein n=1 Tax=Lactobacillus sp. ESL0791 TaxID=2983234 RepID=UPI0023F791CD|nr:hypothetical protein [Lactobacillus sp. ESL0791]MDF7638404.1 hypothetical protein [Lactobacillus sp. ESL0791]